MTAFIRIIPRLDIKGPNLVKGIHLEGLRVLGKPENFARYYYETGADELMYVDAVASLYNRNSLHDIISRTAKGVFIPLTVAGGIRTIDDIRDVLRAGADKVSLNTAAISNPQVIKDASRKFGSSTIVVTIEATKQADGRYLAYTNNGREYTGVEVVSWAKKIEELGAGEIVITSIDREGTGHGFDVELTSIVSRAVSIPVVAHGGAGKLSDISSVIKNGGANAVALASVLHYSYIGSIPQTDKDDYVAEGNTEFLRKRWQSSKFIRTTLSEIKQHLYNEGILCRYDVSEEKLHAQK